jgi:ribonuclease-3
VIRAEGADEAVLGERQVAGLQELLQRGFVVLSADTVAADVVEQRGELADDECARRFDAAVQIDGGDQRFVAVGEQRLLAAAAGLLLPAAEQQVIADALFRRYPAYSEGQKSKVKAAVVSTQSLARHAEQIQLGDHLILGRGEEKTGGRFKQALLADGYEALIAAIYLDGGLDAASGFLLREMRDALEAGSAQTVAQDFKSTLQERLQAMGRPLPEYRIAGEAGPDHRKTFTIEVVVAGQVLGAASGRAKKEAEQEAARLALARHNGES